MVDAENAQRLEDETQHAADRLGPLYLKKYISEVALALAQDLNYPDTFRALFVNFSVTPLQAQELFSLLKDDIRKYKENNSHVFYSKMHQLSMQSSIKLMPDKRAQHLLLLELSTKCINHLNARDTFGSLLKVKTVDKLSEVELSERELAALQYLSGHVIHKTYLQLRKSKHWREEKFQQCITLLRSFKTEPTDDHRLVKAKDRGGLWFISQDGIKIFQEAEFHFIEITSTEISKLDYKSLVDHLMVNFTVKFHWKRLVENSEVVIDKDVGRDLLERILGLFLRIRSFSYAKQIKEKYKLQTKTVKKRSLRTGLKNLEKSAEPS